MEKHIGQIVEKTIRTRGVNLTELAEGLNTSRNSLYNYFRKRDLATHIVSKIGQAIDYDFSADLPELLLKNEVVRRPSLQLPYIDSKYKDKYLELLLKYNALLESRLPGRAKSSLVV
jgi:AcrR family transcriptional regulator